MEKAFSPSLNKAVYYREVDIKMTVMMQDGTYTARDIKFTEGVLNAAKLMVHNEKSMQPYLGDLSVPRSVTIYRGLVNK